MWYFLTILLWLFPFSWLSLVIQPECVDNQTCTNVGRLPQLLQLSDPLGDPAVSSTEALAIAHCALPCSHHCLNHNNLPFPESHVLSVLSSFKSEACKPSSSHLSSPSGGAYQGQSLPLFSLADLLASVPIVLFYPGQQQGKAADSMAKWSSTWERDISLNFQKNINIVNTFHRVSFPALS